MVAFCAHGSIESVCRHCDRDAILLAAIFVHWAVQQAGWWDRCALWVWVSPSPRYHLVPGSPATIPYLIMTARVVEPGIKWPGGVGSGVQTPSQAFFLHQELSV